MAYGFVRHARRAAALFVLGVVSTACAPRARPLGGVTTEPARLPALQLPREFRQTVFRWEFQEQDIIARGEGVGRIAAPDTGRVDFFLDGGMGAGRAVLVGDDLRIPPAAEFARKFFPPAPLLWATLGRLAVPAGKDTVARVEGDTLRADINVSRNEVWRIHVVLGRLARVERISGGRIVEQVVRTSDTRMRYDQLENRRSLTIDVTKTFTVSGFNREIWAP